MYVLSCIIAMHVGEEIALFALFLKNTFVINLSDVFLKTTFVINLSDVFVHFFFLPQK